MQIALRARVSETGCTNSKWLHFEARRASFATEALQSKTFWHTEACISKSKWKQTLFWSMAGMICSKSVAKQSILKHGTLDLQNIFQNKAFWSMAGMICSTCIAEHWTIVITLIYQCFPTHQQSKAMPGQTIFATVSIVQLFPERRMSSCTSGKKAELGDFGWKVITNQL